MLLRFQSLKFLSVQLIKNFMVAVSGFKSISPVSSYRLLAHVRARECFLLLRHIDFVMRCMKLEALSLSLSWPTTRDRMMAQASDRPNERTNTRSIFYKRHCKISTSLPLKKPWFSTSLASRVSLKLSGCEIAFLNKRRVIITQIEMTCESGPHCTCYFSQLSCIKYHPALSVSMG